MSLYTSLLADLKKAMLAKETTKLMVLRALKTAIMKKEIDQRKGGEATLSDQEVLAVITKEAKQRKDSIEQFEAAGRNDLADKEKEELVILETYLPKQLGEEEINQLIDEVFEKVKPTGPSDMGKIMGQLMPKVKGKADGGMVNRLVKAKLNT